MFNKHDGSIESKFVLARQIADSLLYLHAVNWLYKGLRDAGIVFVGSASALEDLGRLLISGIGFSIHIDQTFARQQMVPVLSSRISRLRQKERVS